MSTLDNKNVLSHRIRWIAYPKPLREVGKVDFLIDGKVRWIERNTPYVYGDDSNWLVTSWLSPGRHRFTVRASRPAVAPSQRRLLHVCCPPPRRRASSVARAGCAR
jgi:hypothetical protein